MLLARPPIWFHFDWLLNYWIVIVCSREMKWHFRMKIILGFLIAIDQFISGQARATGASAADLSSPSDHFRSPRKGRLQRRRIL